MTENIELIAVKKPRRWPWVVFALLVLVIGIGAWAVVQFPSWSRQKAGAELTKLLERPVSVEAIDVGFFPPRVQIRNFKILEKQGQQATFSVARVATELEWASISKKYPIIKSLKIEKPEIALTRFADGSTSADDLLEKYRNRPKSDKLPEFSIANIEIDDAAVRVDDQVVKSKHAVTALNAKLPFVSSLAVDQEVWVKPSLSLKLDERLIEGQAESLPFEGTHKSRLKLNLEPFELGPWLPYLPKGLVVVPTKARLQSRMNIDFAQEGKTHLLITGSIKVEDLALYQAIKTSAFDKMDVQAQALSIESFELRPLEQKFLANGIALVAPKVSLLRPVAAGSAPNLSKAKAAPDGIALAGPKSAATPAAKPSTGEAPPSFDWALADVAVSNGQLNYEDPSFAPKPLKLSLRNLQGTVAGLGLSTAMPVVVRASAQADHGELAKVEGKFSKSGGRSELSWELDKASLVHWWWFVEPYLVSTPKGGVLQSKGHVAFGGTESVKVDKLQAKLGELTLRSKSGLNWLKFAGLQVSDLSLDLGAKDIGLARVDVQKLQVIAKRDMQGGLSFTELLPVVQAATASSVQPKALDLGWKVKVGELKLERSRFELTDAVKGRDTDLKFEDLRILAKNLSLDTHASFTKALQRTALPGATTGTATTAAGAGGATGAGVAVASKPASLELSANFNQKGRIQLKGPLHLQPLNTQLELDAKDINVLPFQPYFVDYLNAVITRGELSAQGKLEVSIASENPVQFRGSLAVSQFASVTKQANEDLLKWKTLTLVSTHFNTQPLLVDLGDIELSEFYSRLFISPQGRFNLQDLAASKDGSGAVAGASKAEPTKEQSKEQSKESTPQATSNNEVMTPTAQSHSGTSPPLASQVSVSQAPVANASAQRLPVRIGKVTLNNGNIDFSDYFVKPNYSANLTNMSGSITELTPEKAGQLQLAGRIDGTGTLAIQGSLNPLNRNLFLDIKADATDIDLPRLSTYSGKYIGYGIEKGKLSTKVSYKLENRQLQAENRVILDQLTFGDKVDSPTAMKLPVLFAVSLLKDRNGVIDIEMPIGGSLDDPKFSISSLVIRMIGNLIVKVITSPFSLLASLGGGKQQELSKLDFEVGKAELSAVSIEKAQSIAKALTDRPGLKLDIGGRADPVEDAANLKKLAFERLLKAQKLRESVKGNESVGAIDAIEISSAEYPKYLVQAFQASPLPKPKNWIGVQKAVPIPEIEKAMRDSVKVEEAQVLNLANRRAQALKDWLAETGKISTDRLYITAPKIDGSPRVELGLK